MSTLRQPRIIIDELPAFENLTDEEKKEIIGAGNFRPQVEHLESREMMASNITASLLSSGTLRIEGTENADKIYVLQDSTSKNVSVGTAPGKSDIGVFTGGQVQRIEIFGLGGDDIIDLQGTDIAHHVKVDSIIDGGAGKDTIRGGDAVDRIFGGAGVDALFGNAGNDFLFAEADGGSLSGGTGSDITDASTVRLNVGEKTFFVGSDSFLYSLTKTSGAVRLSQTSLQTPDSFTVRGDYVAYLQTDGKLTVVNARTNATTVSRDTVKEFAVAGKTVVMLFADEKLRQQNLDGTGWDYVHNTRTVLRHVEAGGNITTLWSDGYLESRRLSDGLVTFHRDTVKEFAVAGKTVVMLFEDGFQRQQNLDGTGWSFGNVEDGKYDKVRQMIVTTSGLFFLEQDGDLKKINLATGQITLEGVLVNSISSDGKGGVESSLNSVGLKWQQLDRAEGDLGQYLRRMDELGAGRQLYYFSNGAIYHISSTKNYAITGRRWGKYVELSEQGVDFGMPKGDAYDVAGHSAQDFDGGTIFYLGSKTRTFAVGTDIWRAAQNASLGLPTGDGFEVDGSVAVHFENGGIYRTAGGEIIVIGNKLLWQRYLDMGGESSDLGLPTSNGLDFGGGWSGHSFERGSIWVKGSEVRVVEARTAGQFEESFKQAQVSRPSFELDSPIDLSNTTISNKVVELLKKLAQGNEGSAGVKSLQVDPLTGDVSGEYWVRHRHVWSGWWGKTTAYDDTMTGSFHYNIFSQEIKGNLDLGRGVKLDLKDIYAAIQGDFSGWLIKASGYERQSNYTDRVSAMRDQYGPGNVYYASESFVDWAGPETIARWGATAYATGGNSLASVPAEIANRLNFEGAGITAWLQSRIGELAKELINALATRQDIVTPYFELRWDRVEYTYASQLFPSLQTPPVSHLGYAIVLKL